MVAAVVKGDKMTIYDEVQGVAQELLSDFGQGTIVYLKQTPGSGPRHNPGKGETRPFVVKGGVATGVSMKYVQMSLAKASDLQVTLPVDPRFIPNNNDTIKIDAIEYKITQVIQKPAAGTPVVYVLIVGRGE